MCCHVRKICGAQGLVALIDFLPKKAQLTLDGLNS